MELARSPAAWVRPARSAPYLKACGWGIVLLLALLGRATAGWSTPLWFDETFSAVIATQPTFGALIDWCRNEVGGPVYYVLLWCWAHLFGAGATTLRLPSLIASILAPLVVLWVGHRDWKVRATWAALLALWAHELDYSSSARCYALLVLINTAAAIAYVRLLREPGRRRALAWVALSALGILTHYHNAILATVQGILFLAIHRKAAIRCWPSLFALVPVAAWMAVHLPILLRFSGTGSWYPPVTALDLLMAPAIFMHSLPVGLALLVGVPLSLYAGRHDPAASRTSTPEVALALSGVIGLALLLLLSMVKPSFTWRYAAVFAPAILFGVAIWLRRIGDRAPLATIALLAMLSAGVATEAVRALMHPELNKRFDFNLDQPSQFVAAGHPRILGFLWDSPTGAMSDDRRIDEVAGYFLRAAGHPVAVRVFKTEASSPPSDMIAAQAARGAFDSLIWISDQDVPGTREIANPHVLERMGWRCRDFGRDAMAVIGCRKR